MSQHWNKIAVIRKSQIESGKDLTFSKVFVPYYERLVSTLCPRSILEVGGGTGHLALALHGRTDRYVMIEPAPGMYGVAHELLAGTKVELRHCDLASFADSDKFDLVLSHMCAQTIRDISTFFVSASKHLAAAGHFAFSIPHPLFYNDYKEFFARETFQYIVEQSNTVSFSISLDHDQVFEGVPYYHRPLSTYVSQLANAGLCLTHLREVFPARAIQELYGAPWDNPRYLVFGGCGVSPNGWSSFSAEIAE